MLTVVGRRRRQGIKSSDLVDPGHDMNWITRSSTKAYKITTDGSAITQRD